MTQGEERRGGWTGGAASRGLLGTCLYRPIMGIKTMQLTFVAQL